MLERIFSLTQRKDETSTRFLARVAIRVLTVIVSLVAFAYITFNFLIPFLDGLRPYSATQLLVAILLVLVILAVVTAGTVALGGVFTLIQMAWRVGATRSPLIEVVPNLFQICLLFVLASIPAYFFVRGLVFGEIEHLSHRIRETYRFDVEPTGYLVHMALHLSFAVPMFWYLHRFFKESLGKYRALTSLSTRTLRDEAAPRRLH